MAVVVVHLLLTCVVSSLLIDFSLSTVYNVRQESTICDELCACVVIESKTGRQQRLMNRVFNQVYQSKYDTTIARFKFRQRQKKNRSKHTNNATRIKHST